MNRRIAALSLGWIGISMVGDAVPAILLPHQLLARGQADATTLGLITLLAIGLAAALQPVAGRWSDSVGRWPVISVGVAVAVLGLGLMLGPGTARAGAVVSLLGVSVAQAGHQPLLPQWVPRELRGRASGIKSALDVAGATVGFLLLAALLGQGASLAAVAMLAALLAVPFAIAYAVLPRGRRQPSVASLSLREAFRLGATLPAGLLPVVLSRFFFLLGIYAVGRFLLLFVAERLSLDADAAAEQAGMALALLALITVA
ncbi:MAG: MFS transporter, partial [Chloroflexi bacterium]|nr:MFS transporter [Chloroflexota bacterium]